MTSPVRSLLKTLPTPESGLSGSARMLMLVTAFLGWFCAGILLSITSVAMQPAAIDLLSRTGQLDQGSYFELIDRSKQKQDSAAPMTAADRAELQRANVLVGSWIAWLKCAFLFGAAFGGLIFGLLGDRFGRTKGMGLAILTYSLMSGVALFSMRPVDLLICWFLACMGVGGMWPNGVALVAEAWAKLSRTAAAGIIGAAANVGISLMSYLMRYHPPAPSGRGESVSNVISSLTDIGVFLSSTKASPVPADWRWVMVVATIPALLGIVSLVAVPESSLWLASRRKAPANSGDRSGTRELFAPPYMSITFIGIALATIPLIGGWGSADWMVQWADHAGGSNPSLKADVNNARAISGIVGCLLGGWIASTIGRRLTYFLTSAAALLIAQYTFRMVLPTDPQFLWWVSLLGFFNGIYFGWLPFCLPELFPTRVRSTGAGVSFNFGRILTAVTVFATGALMAYFKGDYAQIGRVTSFVYAIGLCIIWFAPDTSSKQLDD